MTFKKAKWYTVEKRVNASSIHTITYLHECRGCPATNYHSKNKISEELL